MLTVAEFILSLITTAHTPFSDSHSKATLHTIISVQTKKYITLK